LRKLLLCLAACALIGGCAGPGQQSAEHGNDVAADKDAEAFSTFLSARFADSQNDMAMAARYYGQSLQDDPGNDALLQQAFSFAITSGDVDGAAKYALQIVAKKPDDAAARLALAVIAFKHHDFADARKQLALSAKSPFTVPVFDAWAAAATGDAAAAAADMKTLQAQPGSADLGAFHNALILDTLNKTS
jgi:predicted Zn-dependent protease